MNRTEMCDTEEFGTIFGVPVNKVRRLAAKGEIPAIKIGRSWLIPRAYVDQVFADLGFPRAEPIHAQ